MERAMNWETVKGRWTQLRGAARKQWGKLTDDDVDLVAGERDKLVGKIQERYGYAKDRAEHAIDEWIAGIDTKPPQPSSR
jgi:uncharacterized protein YjbJ (UPF0337 family)